MVDKVVRRFTYGGVTRFLANAFSGAKAQWRARQFERHPHVDEKRLLPFWGGTVRDNGSEVIDQCERKPGPPPRNPAAAIAWSRR